MQILKTDFHVWMCRVDKSKKAKIRNRYNKVPHLTQDTIWECDKNTTNPTLVADAKSLLQASKEACIFENYFSYLSSKIYVVGTQKNHLNEMVLWGTQNTCLTYG